MLNSVLFEHADRARVRQGVCASAAVLRKHGDDARAGNRSFSSRTKNIALRFFYIRELVSEGRISINYISSDDNPADIGTEHLNKHRFKHLLDLISNFDVNNIKK